jgi:hypothetical protein
MAHARPDDGPRLDAWRARLRARRLEGTVSREEVRMKGSEKPKKLAKKAPQKTLKEKRSEKRAAAKKNI